MSERAWAVRFEACCQYVSLNVQITTLQFTFTVQSTFIFLQLYENRLGYKPTMNNK